MSSPRFFSSGDKGKIQCSLCPSRCILSPGSAGKCRVRLNRDGKAELPFYGFITALALDPIEKKPLYHFRPGTEILSAGFAGCNLRCPFCQNWHISQNTDTRGRFYTPAELIDTVKKNAGGGGSSLAYTYSEPLVHAEFLLDCMKEARKAGIANVLVTNGCVNSEVSDFSNPVDLPSPADYSIAADLSSPAEEILELCDAANIDLKCFSEETYSKVLGGNLDAVIRFIRRAVEKEVHVEITTLVVPGLNDSEEELNACVDFIAGLNSSEKTASEKSFIPWHLSAYHPDWKWNAPPTAPAFLTETAIRAGKRLAFVYTGNVAGEKNNTSCSYCGKTLISRRGYRVDTSGLSLKKENGKLTYFCAACGKKAPVRA